jgi:hypothetical protein
LHNLEHEKETQQVHDRVTGKVSLELQELRNTIKELSHDLREPIIIEEPKADIPLDHQRQYTRLDDVSNNNSDDYDNLMACHSTM